MSNYIGDAGVTVVVFSTGTVLFDNPMSAVDSLPIVAGRSEVVGVCAFANVDNVDIPPIKDEDVTILTSTIKLRIFMLI